MGAFFGLLIVTTGMFMGNSTVKRTGYVLLVATALFTLPAFFTGEGAEEIVEELPGMSHNLIHEHEEMAELSLWLAELLGIMAFISLLAEMNKHRSAKLAGALTLVLNLICFGSMVKTGNSGGEIRRPELRSEQVDQSSNTEAEHDDED